MENSKKETAGLFAELCLDSGLILIPQERFEELVRAETERDLLEMALACESGYYADKVLAAIQLARSKVCRTKTPAFDTAAEGGPDAE